jgi:ParB-like chromosome segregation protein Spo0J
MKEPSAPENLQLAIEQIGTRFSGLRVIDPRAEAAMVRSLARYRQISPVIVGCLQPDCYEMVDGFKRLRGCQKLGQSFLHARLIPGAAHVLKAAMIDLNLPARSIGDLDKAFVIRSLHREDALSQVQIATLLNRHKSWVCRRLALAERLAEEVVEYLRLGLINVTTGRELAKLPRGNQLRALKTILKYRLTTAETTRLVSLLLTEPAYSHECLLGYPGSILDERQPPRPPQTPLRSIYGRLAKIEKLFTSEKFRQHDLVRLMQVDRGRVLSFIENMQACLHEIKHNFDVRNDAPVSS